jgi:hypothetical protein
VRDPESGWVRLSAAEFTLLWAALGLGPLPAVLGIPHLGRTETRLGELNQRASRTLAERGLGTIQRPAPDLVNLLALIADHQVSLDLVTEDAGTSLRVLAVANDRDAAVVARVADDVRLGPVARDHLLGALLDVVVPKPAGPGHSTNISAADFDTACADGDQFGQQAFLDVLHYAGLRPSDANALSRALIERRGGGRLGATARDRTGRETRTLSTINWLDTESGRYVLRRNGDWVTFTPADMARLTSMAREMLADTRRG